MSSNSDVYVEFCEYHDKTKSIITRSLTELVSHLCIPYSANTSNDGLDTYIGWRMDAFQKTSCMVNWPQGTEKKVVPNFDTKTSASGYEGPKRFV